MYSSVTHHVAEKRSYFHVWNRPATSLTVAAKTCG